MAISLRVAVPAAAVPLAVLAVLGCASPALAYQVQPGDTLWAISQRTGIPVDQIVRENGITNPNLIVVGQILNLEPAQPSSGASYTVHRGDTLWSISRRTGVPLATLISLNGIADPRHLAVGQRLLLAPAAEPPSNVPPSPAGTAATMPAPLPLTGAAARQVLVQAAQTEGVDPDLVLAVALWESGDNNQEVSKAGAVGLMQILPSTAAWAGPALLGRPADIDQPSDNALLGAALLRHYLDDFGQQPSLALAAYYQGETATRRYGVFPSSRHYVDGILALRRLLAAST
jgi:LysM repeat protein